jgi:hypothetical protein
MDRDIPQLGDINPWQPNKVWWAVRCLEVGGRGRGQSERESLQMVIITITRPLLRPIAVVAAPLILSSSSFLTFSLLLDLNSFQIAILSRLVIALPA